MRSASLAQEARLNPIDQIPLGLLVLVCILSQAIVVELGFRYGRWRKGHGIKAQLAQVRAIMGASLGLVAFMLAFAFSMAQQHFEDRNRAYMQEVSAIDAAYRGADMLEEYARRAAQDLLVEFASLRLNTGEAARDHDLERAVAMIRESERIHDALWALAEASMEGAGEGERTSIFAQSILAMISAHDARLQATLFNRISPVIWITLGTMALIGMLVMGYQAGLTGTRSSLATWSLALAFSIVMALIIDLDRPAMTLFKMNQQLMIEFENRMDSSPLHHSVNPAEPRTAAGQRDSLP